MTNINTLERLATQNLKNVYSQWDIEQLRNGENVILKDQSKDFIIGYKIAMAYQWSKNLVRENFLAKKLNDVSPKISDEIYADKCEPIANESR